MTDMHAFNPRSSGYYVVENADSLVSSSPPSTLAVDGPKKLSGARHLEPAYDSALHKAYFMRIQGGLVEWDLASGEGPRSFRTGTQ
ncbi:hypothetical protein [Streptomyces chartreusis]|uniref:hypothetical protein n=1 Tax=Streptomyces chartreusis TaxID=1969 RepID=UPI002E172761